MALPARVVRALDAGVVAVAPLVTQPGLDASVDGAARGRPRGSRPGRCDVVGGGHRHPHVARGASNGGFTFCDRGDPYGRTKGAKGVVALEVTGLAVGALVVPACTHENRAGELMLEHLTQQGVTGRLELVLVDRGVTAAAARTLGRCHGLGLHRVGWDDNQPVLRPIWHVWRVEVARGRFGGSRRLGKSFENTTTSATGWLQVACIATTLRHLTGTSSPTCIGARSVTEGRRSEP